MRLDDLTSSCRFVESACRPLNVPRRPGIHLNTVADYWATKPPSTGSAAPVTKDDSSLARYSAIAATSSAVPNRPTGSVRFIECKCDPPGPLDHACPLRGRTHCQSD